MSEYDPRADKKLQGRFLNWAEDPEPVDAWPTGNVFLDWLTGIGGVPRGRVVETYGPESSGKSTLGLQTAAAVWHQLGIPTHYADFEDALDFRYCKALGLTPEALLVEQPESLEDYLEGLDRMIDKGANVALSIVDSVAAARARQDLKGNVDDRTAGMNRARIWTSWLSSNVHRLNEAGITLLLVNQTRVYIDTSPGFTPPGVSAQMPKERTPGGKGIKFYASLRVEFKQSSEVKATRTNPLTLEDEKVAVGKNVWLRVTKNKVAPPPWRKVRLQIRDGIGFDLAQNLLDFGVTHGLVDKGTGGRFTFDPGVLGEPFEVGPMDGWPGEAVAAQTIREHDVLRARLQELTTAKLSDVEYDVDYTSVSSEDEPEDEA